MFEVGELKTYYCTKQHDYIGRCTSFGRRFSTHASLRDKRSFLDNMGAKIYHDYRLSSQGVKALQTNKQINSLSMFIIVVKNDLGE